MFLCSGTLWQLQTRNPEKFNIHVIVNLGQRSLAILAGLVVLGTIWVVFDSWEQQIIRKPKPRLVELTRIDRFYGGIVFVRKLPRRVWDAAAEGDRLIKRSGTFFAILEQRNRGLPRASVGDRAPSIPE